MIAIEACQMWAIASSCSWNEGEGMTFSSLFSPLLSSVVFTHVTFQIIKAAGMDSGQGCHSPGRSSWTDRTFEMKKAGVDNLQMLKLRPAWPKIEWLIQSHIAPLRPAPDSRLPNWHRFLFPMLFSCFRVTLVDKHSDVGDKPSIWVYGSRTRCLIYKPIYYHGN
jgi:hypothetical protein